MSARAGVSPRCSSSFYCGRRNPRCHNKTLAAAKLARERQSCRGREERGREQPTPLQLSSSLNQCHSSRLLPPSPPLPSHPAFLFSLTFAMTSSFPVWPRLPLAHAPTGCFDPTRTPLPLHPLVSSVNCSLLLLLSHVAPIPAIAFRNQ